MTPPRRPLWRTLTLAALAALALAYLADAAATLDGASDDLVPPWVLGRLTAEGRRAAAYDLAEQFAVIRPAPLTKYWIAMRDMPMIAGIGLCPYPPTAALAYAPLGLLPFGVAAYVVYAGSIALVGVVAWAVGRATGGRVGPLAAAVAILYYPAFHDVLRIGQNSMATLALVTLGWQALVRGRDVPTGLWWGLLAYKPQWLVAVGWLPLVTGRPRVLIGMAVTAGAFAVVATAVLGFDAWGRWLEQAAAVDHVYAADPIFRAHLLPLGCDLRNVLNRYFVPAVSRPLGWALIVLVAVVTAVRYRRGRTGDAGLLFAAGLTVAHLYYYDETVFLLPLLVLWGGRATLTWPRVAVLAVLTAAFYAVVPVLDFTAGWPYVPGPTVVVVALWVFSLEVPARFAPADRPAP